MKSSKVNLSSNSYLGWNTASHVKEFGFWNSLTKPTFNFMYGNFQENRFLIDIIKNKKATHVLDVGCATGTTYRYLSNKFTSKEYKYKGFDISQAAINNAKLLYRGNIFYKFTENIYQNLPEIDKEIVYSRDTVMHQEEPLKFLEDLINITSKFLILRLRTRDEGETEWDFNISTQMHYDKYWMPYIVINIEELTNFILKIRKPKSIKINRSYKVLGGHNYRVLPRDLYFKKAGGAETSICIEFSNEMNNNTEINYSEILEGQSFIEQNRKKHFIYRLYDTLIRSAVNR